MRFALRFFSLSVLLILGCVSVNSAQAQEEEIGEMQLIERVAELQQQLESAQVADRDAAEKELLDLGVLVLDYLEPPSKDTPSDAIERTSRIRLALEKIAVESVAEASFVSLTGEMTVAEALQAIRKQTTNDVAFSEQTQDVFLEQKIELDFEKVKFWSALSNIMLQAKLEIDPYGGAPGQLRLVPSRAAKIAAANPNLDTDKPNANEKKIVLPHEVSGVFDLTVTKIYSARNLVNPDLSFCNVTVQVRWEPRVQPISIDLPVDSIKAIDEFDMPIAIAENEAVIYGLVQPEIPELEFMVPIGLVDRQIEVIKSLEATIQAVLPGRVETFRFKKLGRLDAGSEQRKAGAIVTFGGVRKNDDLYGVTVRLGFDEAHNALESHQGWAFNNRMYLENDEGQKYEPVALETLRQDDQELVIQYYFKENPDDLTLVYKTAAAIVQIPVKIRLENIPLP